jgi:hypothetical protein
MKKKEKVKAICLNQGVDINSHLGIEILNAAKTRIPIYPIGPQAHIHCEPIGPPLLGANGCWSCQIYCSGLGFGAGNSLYNVTKCNGNITVTVA